MLKRPFVKAILSVCPSVRYTRDPRLNGSRCRNTFRATRYSDVSSFL